MSITVINLNVPYKLVGLMSLHIDCMNLIKSLRSLHRLWIFTSFSWALPDLRVGASNSHFCRCGSNFWLASTSSVWVSKLQPEQSHCCFRLTLPRALCVVPGHCLLHLPVPVDDLPKRRHHSWPARLFAHERQDTISSTTACMEPTTPPPKPSSQKVLRNGEREGRGENS